MDPNAEAGPSTRWIPPKPVPLILHPAPIRIFSKPVQRPLSPSPGAAPATTTASTSRSPAVLTAVHQPLVIDIPDTPPRKKFKRRTNVEVVIPLRRKKARIILTDTETENEEEEAEEEEPSRLRSTTPRRDVLRPIRLPPPIPPPLPDPLAAFLLSCNAIPGAPRLKQRTSGPMGLPPPPPPPRAFGPRLPANGKPLRLTSDHHDVYHQACGTDATPDLWASSSIFPRAYVRKASPSEQAIRNYILGLRPPRSAHDKAKDKALATLKAAERKEQERKEEAERTGKSASNPLEIDSHDDVPVVPHSQTMPIEHRQPSASAEPSSEDEESDKPPKYSPTPFALITGDDRFGYRRTLTMGPATAVVMAQRMRRSREQREAAAAAAAAAKKQLSSASNSAQADEGTSGAPESSTAAQQAVVARVTRSMLAAPVPPSRAPIRAAARRAAYAEHGTTIGAEVWATIMEFEQKETEWDGAEEAMRKVPAEP